jgi:spoIIIJ-associated protein
MGGNIMDITVSAKTVDDAITEALVELGVTSDQLDYEVIEKGSAGFLGIGTKQAVIKARKKIEKPVVKEEKTATASDNKSFANDNGYTKGESKSVTTNNTYTKTESKPVTSTHSDTKSNNKSVVANDSEVAHSTALKKEFKKETYKDTLRREVSPRKEIELAEVQPETLVAAENFIKDVLKAMALTDATVSSKVDSEGAILINIEGEQMGLLIGKRGQTLDSLQYLANRVANKAQEGYVRVRLDTENYRDRRVETLERLAKNVASKVKRTKRRYALEPMNPYERRIIHSALQGEKEITTYSEGEEPYRKIVVSYVRERKY